LNQGEDGSGRASGGARCTAEALATVLEGFAEHRPIRLSQKNGATGRVGTDWRVRPAGLRRRPYEGSGSNKEGAGSGAAREIKEGRREAGEARAGESAEGMCGCEA